MPALFYATSGAYGIASCVFISYLVRRSERLLQLGRWLLVGVALLHLATIGSLCLHGVNPLQDTAGMLNLTAWLLLIGYLVTGIKWRLGMIGALIVPLALALVISGELTPREHTVDGASPLTALGRLHLTLVALGVAAFALAAAVSLLYLLQESALRHKRLMAIYRHAPPLTTLDDVSRRLTLIGFPLYTIAVIAGVAWSLQLPGSGILRVEYLISAVTWLIFAAVIVARSTVGLRGRRAAQLTIAGFAATALVLLLYAGRSLGGG